MTPEQVKRVKQGFIDRGENIADWADKNKFPRDAVYRVLNNRSAARRGVPHEIAVRLGLKAAQTETAA